MKQWLNPKWHGLCCVLQHLPSTHSHCHQDALSVLNSPDFIHAQIITDVTTNGTIGAHCQLYLLSHSILLVNPALAVSACFSFTLETIPAMSPLGLSEGPLLCIWHKSELNCVVHRFSANYCTVCLLVKTEIKGTRISQGLIKGSCLKLSLSTFKQM